MKAVPITPATLEVARRVMWFEPPEEALASPARLVAYAMAYARRQGRCGGSDRAQLVALTAHRSSLRMTCDGRDAPRRSRPGSSAGSQIRTRCGVARAKSGSQNTDQATKSKRRGSDLVLTAVFEGREAARGILNYLGVG